MSAQSLVKLYGAPRTRALRVAWFLEEIALEYILERVTFRPTSSKFFIQDTPTGKIPTLVDGPVVICESGAIIQYLSRRYGAGSIVPEPDDPSYPAYLQWFHFAESSAFAPIGVVVWLTVYREDAEAHPELVTDARGRASQALLYVEQHLADHEFLAGSFSAADIMLGFTLGAAHEFGLLNELPHASAYFKRLTERPAYQEAYRKLHA